MNLRSCREGRGYGNTVVFTVFRVVVVRDDGFTHQRRDCVDRLDPRRVAITPAVPGALTFGIDVFNCILMTHRIGVYDYIWQCIQE